MNAKYLWMGAGLCLLAAASAWAGMMLFSGEAANYAVAKMPTPVLYTPDFRSVFGGADGKTLKFDDYGEIDEVEFVALSGSVFTVKEALEVGGHAVYRVETDEYPYPTEKGYYVDARFVEPRAERPAERVKVLPSKEAILANLMRAEGSIYTWGGNAYEGIPQLLEWYAPSADIPADIVKQWELSGVDCSGLLYEATQGSTPRNTSSLVTYGTGIAIAGKTPAEIAALLEPLDIIAWKGHTVIVIDGGRAIQSKLDYDDTTEGFQGGVRIMPLVDALAKIMEDRVPQDDYSAIPADSDIKPFVARKWYPR